MHVVFGELIPKTMALQTPDRDVAVAGAAAQCVRAHHAAAHLAHERHRQLILRRLGYEPAAARRWSTRSTNCAC